MGVRRTRLDFERDYTQVPNAWMRDKRLSRRARGLLAEIMTHRVGWRVTIAGLQADGPEGRDAISGGIKELIALGYLVRSQSRDGNGRMKEVEYELCDPATANGKPVSGEPAPTELIEELSTGSTANGFTASGSAVDGSAVDGKSATKNTRKKENQEEEDQGGADAPAPFCSRHPNGTTAKCRACGNARRRWDAARTPAPPAAAPPPRPSSWRPGLCREHLQREDTCEACQQDARRVLEVQFGGGALDAAGVPA